MVRVRDNDIIKGIAITKYRIKHLEKHGMGAEAMREKVILQKQERHKQLRDVEFKK